MNRTYFLPFVLGVFLWSLPASAQVVLVSDIDDTIKESQVLNDFRRIGSGLANRAFYRMADLYRSLANENTQITYVSNAPKELMSNLHAKFLRRNQFPAGPMYLPRLNERDGHKIRSIQSIIEDRAPQTLIMIGDNGEQDPEYYKSIEEQYQGRVRIVTFIRVDYLNAEEGMAPKEGQIPFVTAAEIGLHLHELGLLPESSTKVLLSSSINREGSEWEEGEQSYPGYSLGLPEWIDCREHRPDLSRFDFLSPEVVQLENKINQRCSYTLKKVQIAAADIK